jgi:hypothetical protein
VVVLLELEDDGKHTCSSTNRSIQRSCCELKVFLWLLEHMYATCGRMIDGHMMLIGSVQQDGLAMAGCDLLDSHDGIGICEIEFVA